MGDACNVGERAWVFNFGIT